jgi:Ser/Thr protein kinase RdoA (MazF antagonist)
VIERADGPTMLTALGDRPLTLRRQARLLARRHAIVHAVPAPEWLPAPFGDEGGAQVLLHQDLHPQNVILTAGGPLIIDWEGAARGPAVADVAMTGPERGGGTGGAGAVHQVFPGRLNACASRGERGRLGHRTPE